MSDNSRGWYNTPTAGISGRISPKDRRKLTCNVKPEVFRKIVARPPEGRRKFVQGRRTDAGRSPQGRRNVVEGRCKSSKVVELHCWQEAGPPMLSEYSEGGGYWVFNCVHFTGPKLVLTHSLGLPRRRFHKPSKGLSLLSCARRI